MASREFDLIALKFQDVRRDMRRRINEEIFRSVTQPYVYRPLPSWRGWVVRRWGLVRGYLLNVWDALKGRSFEEDSW